MKISLGSDPEYVIKNRNGEVVSAPMALQLAHDLEEPPKVNTRFGAVFADNVNLELSIDYAKSKQEFLEKTRGALHIAHKIVGEDFTLHAIPSLDWPKAQLNHPICKKFGCQPDYDAFEERENEIPQGAQERSFRTAGGHVHIGYDAITEPTFENRIQAVKLFELIAGIPGVLLDSTPDSVKRRMLYGGAGAHRPKPYGVECRSQSNYWTQTPQLVNFMWDASEIVATELIEANMNPSQSRLSRLPSIINTANVKAAKKVFKDVTDHYPSLYASYESVEAQANMNKDTPLAVTWDF
jgi:hypothetical protein